MRIRLAVTTLALATALTAGAALPATATTPASSAPGVRDADRPRHTTASPCASCSTTRAACPGPQEPLARPTDPDGSSSP